MRFHRRAALAALFLILLPLLLNCNTLAAPIGARPVQPTRAAATAPALAAVQPSPVADFTPPAPRSQAAGEAAQLPQVDALPEADALSDAPAGGAAGGVQFARHVLQDGEPAGCLTLAQQQRLSTSAEMLAYADQLLGLPHPLSRRLLPRNWNALAGEFLAADERALSLSVDDVQNGYWLQRMLNALHVAGFAAWLRETPDQKLHILAISLNGDGWKESPWAAYVEAYWQRRDSTPAGDPAILPALKLPPCAWMIESGITGPVYDGWFYDDGGWPDYAASAAAYVAYSTQSAARVAERIDWLGPEGKEGPNTMCGPLVWAILQDARALPPDFGGWSFGPKSFWLARPASNGRPWALFPEDSYHVYHYGEPLGRFDFSQEPLVAGDFLYTYSEKDGFDHMLVITEVDEDGNVYTVTNLIQVVPSVKTTVERVLLLNLNDLTSGLARQGWYTDRKNGRTGHGGFDVFRWAWVEKDLRGEPVPYTVQPGDTLGLIAERWKTPSDWIARYNGLAAGEVLSVGQIIDIPPNQPK